MLTFLHLLEGPNSYNTRTIEFPFEKDSNGKPILPGPGDVMHLVNGKSYMVQITEWDYSSVGKPVVVTVFAAKVDKIVKGLADG